MFINRKQVGFPMAKSDSFFLRATQDINQDTTYYEGAIDLGAYVDALGKSVMRIHNIAVSFTDSNGRNLDMTGITNASADYQLLTQSQANIVLASDRSVISTGKINASREIAGNGVAGSVSHDYDVLPQMWTNGYLVGVDTIYFGGAATTTWNENVFVSMVLECTVETLTQNAAMALALSQQ